MSKKVRVPYQKIHAKTVQHCRTEDCPAVDMERFAAGVHW